MPDRMTTEGRIEYWYQVFGALTVLFIEVKLKISSQTERLNTTNPRDYTRHFPPRIYSRIEGVSWPLSG